MRAAYKNKRDQYKTEAAVNRIRAQRAEAEAKRLKDELDRKAEEAKKRYEATVYCTNCLHVNNVLIPPGVRVDEGDCVTCRVRGTQKLVISYPGKI